MKALRKYLSDHAEPETALLRDWPAYGPYEHVLVIPAYLESPSFLHRQFDKPIAEKRYLVILVSNHPSGLDDSQRVHALTSHQALSDFCGPAVWQNSSLSLHRLNNADVLLVDRTDMHAIPAKQGVGLARKIGADLATALISEGIVLSRWIMNSDADTELPKDYFNIESEAGNSVAAIYPFRHRFSDDSVGWATRVYEIRMRHYVDGLQRAGSAYAFHSLGSCFAFDFQAYARARGFPKRAGGEDFYLLNKLAKQGRVQVLKERLIRIETRHSNRVPFGTGPSVERMLEHPDLSSAPLFYFPGIFVHLRNLLSEIRTREPALVADLNINPGSLAIIRELGIDRAFAHAHKQDLHGIQYQSHMNGWLDGLKTLRYVHTLRDRHYPNISLRELVAAGWLEYKPVLEAIQKQSGIQTRRI